MYKSHPAVGYVSAVLALMMAIAVGAMIWEGVRDREWDLLLGAAWFLLVFVGWPAWLEWRGRHQRCKTGALSSAPRTRREH